MLYGHGDNAYQYDREIKANFSSNVYFKGPSDKLIKHLQKKLACIGSYPEVASESLSEQIAKLHNLKTKNILVTNGATEAFYLLALLYRNSKSEIFVPSFAEYEDACKLHEHNIKFTSNKELSNKYLSKEDLVWLCNPNNPDGKIIGSNDLELFISTNQSKIIVDEAYTDFTLKKVSLINQIQKFNNLIIVRSLTKKYAIPGLRLGYIAAPVGIIKKLKQLKEPWSVNSLAIEAGKFLLKNGNSDFDIKHLIQLSLAFQEKLNQIKGIEVIPSQTSYFLVKLNRSATQTTEYLVNHHRLLVRNASNFKSLGDSYIRISTCSEEDNNKLISALKQWM